MGPPVPGQGYGAVSALDTVAHEFGHGVIYSLKGSGGFTDDALDEGFADVIGVMVEKKRHPTGTGLEQNSDWHLFEDQDCGHARSADIDDGASGHSFCGGNVDNKYHVNDEPMQTDYSGHRTGNMLVVAYKLLAEGGENVWCDANPTDPSCGAAMTGVGVHAASRILFDTLRYYVPYSVSWSHLPFFAQEAAFNTYNRCTTTGYDAQAEQEAVQSAFARIGYPSSGLTPCMYP
jgi:Zn-dependent metalloprotease